MVVTMVWMESWAVVVISLCVVCSIAVIFLCCICFEKKKKYPSRFYFLDQNGIREIESSEIDVENANQKTRNLFRYLPAKMLSSSDRTKHQFDSEYDLIQSMEVADAFNRAVLRLEPNDSNLVSAELNPEREDDIKSCISNDSKYTFYSTYPTRQSI